MTKDLKNRSDENVIRDRIGRHFAIYPDSLLRGSGNDDVFIFNLIYLILQLICCCY